MSPVTQKLPAPLVRRGMRLSILEGCAFAWMVGMGETFLLADAIRLGATRLQQGLVVTLPLCLGALGPVVCLRILARSGRRKPFAVAAAAVQALNLFALAAVDALGFGGPLHLIAFAVMHQLSGQALGTAWSSWFGDLVPADGRGKYFARRNGFVYGTISAGMLVGGLVLQRLEPGPAGEALSLGGHGFAVLFACAGAARGVSALLLALSPEPQFAGLAARDRVLQYLRTARGSRAWRLVLAAFALQLAVYVAGPYFIPYVLETLRFSYVELTIATLTVMVAKVVMLPAWGRAIDQLAPRAAFTLAAVLLALVPAPWLWADGLGWIVAGYAFSGFAWAGYEVALFTLLVASSYRDTRPQLFAVHAAGNGIGQLLGGLAGAGIAGVAAQDLRAVFAASLVLRLCIALAAPLLVPAVPGEPRLARRSVLLRVIGLRPMGGVTHRPLLRQEGEREGDEAGTL